MNGPVEAAHIVVMGVAGSGKTTLGRALAARLARPFLEGDDYHPPENLAAMTAGRALDDRARDGWIAALARAANASPPAIIACSALNATVRGWLEDRCARPVLYLQLHLDPATLRERLRSRPDHFMGPAMLDSQLAALDPPPQAVMLEGAQPLATLLADAIVALETQLSTECRSN